MDNNPEIIIEKPRMRISQIGIYKITSPSDKIYIGQSIDLEKRKRTYLFNDCKGQIKLYNSLKKYGFEKHLFEVLELCEIQNLNIRERYWQDYFDVLSTNGLNCKLTETKDKSGKWSDEVKKKMSETAKKQTKETKKLISEAKKGKKRSFETRKKISESHKGKKLSEKNKKLLIDSIKGKQKSEEHKRKISQSIKLYFKNKKNNDRNS